MVDSPKGNINSGWSIDSARLCKNIVAKVWELQSTSAAAFRNGKLPPKLYPLSWIRFYFIYIYIYIYNIFLVINLENGTVMKTRQSFFTRVWFGGGFGFFMGPTQKTCIFSFLRCGLYFKKVVFLKKTNHTSKPNTIIL
jgi:hypothetical protein